MGYGGFKCFTCSHANMKIMLAYKGNINYIIAMQTNEGNLHLEIQTSRKSPVGLIRTTFRENGQIKHIQFGRISGCSYDQLKMLQLAFREKVIPNDSPEAFKLCSSKEYGASRAIAQLVKSLELDKTLYSRNEAWVKDALVMIIGRIVFAGSKLSLCNHFDTTSLWELFGINDRPDVEDHCYKAMDRLLERQKHIQKNLARKHLSRSHLILYDITSSYFEGEYKNSEIVDFGYNRDGKKGREQVVIGLVCTCEGCPIGIEVYPGNTKDSTTVVDKVNEIKDDYNVEKIIFVGDRGMLTSCNREALKSVNDLQTITALTHPEMLNLLERKVVQIDLFDENNIHEVIDPDAPSRRYMLCRNPLSAQREAATRQRLLDLTREGLEEIAKYQKALTVEKLGARVGKLLARYKMNKFVLWKIEADQDNEVSNNHRLQFSFDERKISDEKCFDGCYVITTDVDKTIMDENTVVKTYKNLTLVEQAFRNLKTVQLEVRPMYHKKDDRLRAHVFICMLAYYVQWHMQQRLKPLFAEDGEGSDRRWTFRNVIESLMSITRNKVNVNGVNFYQISDINPDQRKILELLNVAM
jgi:transposase